MSGKIWKKNVMNAQLLEVSIIIPHGHNCNQNPIRTHDGPKKRMYTVTNRILGLNILFLPR